MNPETYELQKQINELKDKLNHLNDVYYQTHYIDKDVFSNPVIFRGKVNFFKGNPVGQASAITSPTGGATVDAQSRTAIDSIIVVLQNLGLTL